MQNYALTNDVPDYIQVGIAKKNPNGITYEEHPPGYFNKDNVHDGHSAKKETRTEWAKEYQGSPAGAIIAVILILLVVGGGIGFFLYRRRKAAAESADDVSAEDDEMSRKDSLVSSEAPDCDGKIN